MAFVITRTEDEEEEDTEIEFGPSGELAEAQQGFLITPAGEEEDQSFSLARDVAGPAAKFGTAVLDTLAQFGGGGKGSIGEAREQLRSREQGARFDERAQDLASQGLSEEQITEQIGQRPGQFENVEEALETATGGALLPANARQRMIDRSSQLAGEFVGIELMTLGSGKAAKEAARAGKGFVKSPVLKGVLQGAKTGALFGIGSQIAEESGGGPLSSFATGLAFSSGPALLKAGVKGIKALFDFGRGLLSKTKPAEGIPKFLTEAQTPKALADLQLSSKDLAGRVSKTSDEMLGTFDKSLKDLAAPHFKEVGPFRAAEIEKQLVKENQNAILDTISPGAGTQKKSWEGVQRVVDENFDAAHKAYSTLYDAVDDAVARENILVTPKETYLSGKNIYRDLQRSIVKAPEEGGVKRALGDLVELLQPKAKEVPKFEWNPKISPKKNVALRAKAEAAAKLKPKPKAPQIPLSRLMAGKRSINRLIRKSDIIPAPVDLLKPVGRSMKRDTLAALAEHPSVKTAYEAAEESFKRTQDIFNNEAMIKLRKSTNPEDLSSFVAKPSNLEKLRVAAGDNKKTNDLIDRLVVENIASKGKAEAQALAKESRQYLSKKAQAALDDILEYGDSLTSKGQTSIANRMILEDLQKSFTTGAPPAYTAKLMGTPAGYKIVQDTLAKSPKGKKMFKALQRQIIEDALGSTLDAGKQIDFVKAKDIFKDPHFQTIVRESLGQRGVDFFSKLEKYGANMAENLKTFEARDPSLFQKLSDKYLTQGVKYTLYGLAGAVGPKALIPVLGVEAVKRAHRAKLQKVLLNPEGQSVIRQMGKARVSPQEMDRLLKRFAGVVNAPDSEEKK